MKAAVITGAGGPDVLEIRELPRPVPARHEVLIRVVSSALNRADLLQRMGRYAAPRGVPPDIPGLEFAGEVVAVGDEASRWRRGSRVMGIIGGGAHAEYLVAHEEAIARVPEAMSFKQAGAVPEVFITAFDALQQADIKEGEYVLVHAAASGVGLAAIQLAIRFNAIPFGTTRSKNKIDAALAAGAAEVFSLDADRLDKLKDRAEQQTRGHGFDVVLDLNGGPYLSASLGCLAVQGRLICIGTPAGRRAEINLGVLLSQRAHVIGTVIRARSIEEKIKLTQEFSESVLPGFSEGKLTVTIDSEFPLERIGDAQRRLESNETVGKVALRIAQR